jgi:UDPglucose 6-dehydrogenase
MAKISIIGSGTVESIVGKGLRKLGNEVVFFDIDEKRVKHLQNLGLDATNDLNRAIYDSEISFVCVPTPTKNGKIDLSYIKSAVESLALSLRSKQSYHLVVIKSTVVSMTTEKVLIPILRRFSGKQVGLEIGVCVEKMSSAFFPYIEGCCGFQREGDLL